MDESNKELTDAEKQAEERAAFEWRFQQYWRREVMGLGMLGDRRAMLFSHPSIRDSLFRR